MSYQPGVEAMPFAPVVPGEEGGINRRMAIVVSGLALTGLVGGLGYKAAFGGGNSANATPVPSASPMSDKAINCDTLQFTAVDADASWDSQAALPRNEVTSKAAVQPYINSLFSVKGPLGGNASAASLAGVESIITISATDKNAAKDPNYSIVEKWKGKLSQYAAKGGLEVAKQDCADTETIFGEVASYSDNWAHVGDKVTEFKFNRDDHNRINGLRVVNELVTNNMVSPGVKGALDAMTGIQYTYNPAAHDVQSAFGDYLETADGRLFAKGYRPEESGNLNQGTPSPSPDKGSNGNQGGSNGGGVAPGKQSENNPNGPNPGPGVGPSAEASPGKDNTPNGGSTPTTPTGGNTPAPSETPGPTHSPTPSPSPSPTPSPTPSRTPSPSPSPSHSPSSSPSPSPKGPAPSCTPNPPYVIC